LNGMTGFRQYLLHSIAAERRAAQSSNTEFFKTRV
jgi:hypothetical protein